MVWVTTGGIATRAILFFKLKKLAYVNDRFALRSAIDSVQETGKVRLRAQHLRNESGKWLELAKKAPELINQYISYYLMPIASCLLQLMVWIWFTG